MINYLCGKFNLTVLVYTLTVNRLLFVDEEQKEIKGILGREVNKVVNPNHQRL